MKFNFKFSTIKSSSLQIIKKAFIFTAFSTLFIGTYVFAATITWPNTSPDWSSVNGLFMDYFDKIFTSPWSATNWIVKEAASVTDGSIMLSDLSQEVLDWLSSGWGYTGGDLTVTWSLFVTSNTNVSWIVSANKFSGDWSLLTGINWWPINTSCPWGDEAVIGFDSNGDLICEKQAILMWATLADWISVIPGEQCASTMPGCTEPDLKIWPYCWASCNLNNTKQWWCYDKWLDSTTETCDMSFAAAWGFPRVTGKLYSLEIARTACPAWYRMITTSDYNYWTSVLWTRNILYDTIGIVHGSPLYYNWEYKTTIWCGSVSDETLRVIGMDSSIVTWKVPSGCWSWTWWWSNAYVVRCIKE